MKSTLHVKNFGPIKDAKLELSNVNVLIGPQASGKSTLAKLYTICKSPALYCRFEKRVQEIDIFDEIETTYARPDFDEFISAVSFYSMTGYLSKNTSIEFNSLTHSFKLKNEIITYEDNMNAEKIYKSFQNGDVSEFLEHVWNLRKISLTFNIDCAIGLYFIDYPGYDKELSFQDIKPYLSDFEEVNYSNEQLEVLNGITQDYLNGIFQNNAIYIPAERTIINLIKQASLNLMRNKVPIPAHLLDYAAQYESAVANEGNLDLEFLKAGVKYEYVSGEDMIFFSKKKSIKLSDSASGFQSVVPMLLPLVQASKKRMSHFSFVIEEPETNLFPKAQYDVLKFIESGRADDHGVPDWGAIHTYTTHSPFVLSGFNNMLYAHQKSSSLAESDLDILRNIIPEECWISLENFSAYEIVDGMARSIVDKETGLIDETVVDQVSDDLMNDFKQIALLQGDS